MMEEYKVERELYPDGRDGLVRITKSYVFKLSDFVIDKLPSCCGRCPIAYSSIKDCGCGRADPIDELSHSERPSTCKLRTIDEYLNEETMRQKGEQQNE